MKRWPLRRFIETRPWLLKLMGQDSVLVSFDVATPSAFFVFYNIRSIASASSDGTVQVWNAITGNGIYTFRVLSKYVQELDWSPNSKLIAAQSVEDAIVQVLRIS